MSFCLSTPVCHGKLWKIFLSIKWSISSLDSLFYPPTIFPAQLNAILFSHQSFNCGSPPKAYSYQELAIFEPQKAYRTILPFFSTDSRNINFNPFSSGHFSWNHQPIMFLSFPVTLLNFRVCTRSLSNLSGTLSIVTLFSSWSCNKLIFLQMFIHNNGEIKTWTRGFKITMSGIYHQCSIWLGTRMNKN